jgi:hypothetical protein
MKHTKSGMPGLVFPLSYDSCISWLAEPFLDWWRKNLFEKSGRRETLPTRLNCHVATPQPFHYRFGAH